MPYLDTSPAPSPPKIRELSLSNPKKCDIFSTCLISSGLKEKINKNLSFARFKARLCLGFISVYHYQFFLNLIIYAYLFIIINVFTHGKQPLCR